MPFRELATLLVFAFLIAGCPTDSVRDGDADTDVDRGADDEDAGEAESPDSADAEADSEEAADGEGDVLDDAETWDFGGDLWDPMRNCDAAVEDPPAWVAPSCGEGCTQAPLRAAPYGPFAASEHWIVYESWWHTWAIDRLTGREVAIFCHPPYLGSYGVAVEGDIAVFALGTHFPTTFGEADYAAIWAMDLSSGSQWRVLDWVKPYDRSGTDLVSIALSERRVAFKITEIDRASGDGEARRGDIYSVDVDSRFVTRITDLGWPCCLGWPDIAGDWVAYSTTDAVLAHNVRLGTTIGPDIPGDQIWPRTDGVNVVWLDHRNYPGGYGRGGSWDIYSYNFASETEVRITSPSTPAAEDAAPDMLGDVIVWSDRRNATAAEPHHTDLFMYRYSTGVEQQLTFATGAARSPKLTSDAVYFDWIPDPEPDPDAADHAICEQTLPPP